MRKIFEHPLHNTQVVLEVADGRIITDSQKKKLEKVLCGMDDCICNLYPVISKDGHWYINQNGEVMSDDIAKAAAALGAIKSEQKAKTSAENGRLGGRPKKSKDEESNMTP